ncbi:MAG: transglutaminase domain-containing protein [Anaerolineae bacterium]
MSTHGPMRFPGDASTEAWQQWDALDDTWLVVETYTGVMTSTYQISPKLEDGAFETYSTANFQQEIIETTADYSVLRVVALSDLATDVPYPLDESDLPQEALDELQPQPDWIQSDDPAIVSKAAELAAEALREDMAVVRIVAWVRAHTRFQEDCTENDALSVLDTGIAKREGFATLTCALLRAAGIPARYVVGAMLPSDLVHGVSHAWLEVYYPDVGWIASDPQFTANWIDAAHVRHGFAGVGTSVVVTRVSHLEDLTYVYDQRTSYAVAGDADRLRAAYTPGGGGFPLRTDLEGAHWSVRREDPPLTVHGTIANDRTCGTAWTLTEDASWLTVAPAEAHGASAVTVTVEADDLEVGSYAAEVQLTAPLPPDPGCDPPAQVLTHTFDIMLDVTRRPDLVLPLLARGWRPTGA